MKNIVYLTFFLQMILSLSCKKERTTIIDTMVEVLVVGQNSQNLLTTPSLLNEDNINLYFVTNGQSTLFNQGYLTAAKGFLIKPLDGSTDVGLKIFPNTGTPETTKMEYPVTLIELGNFGIDTIKCEVLNDRGSKTISKVWYNGELKYDQDLKQGSRRFTIVKQ